MKAIKVLTAIILIISMLALPALATEFVPSAEQQEGVEVVTKDIEDVPSSDVQSPQTGVSETGVAIAAISVMICAAGAVVIGKKLKRTAV